MPSAVSMCLAFNVCMRALTSSGLGVGIKGDRDVGVLPALRVHEKLEVNGYVVHGLPAPMFESTIMSPQA
jgi:hypothetical protein